MNIYDLDSEAQPAPWTVDDSTPPSWAMHHYLLDGGCYTKQEMANALMSAHCRNNFLKALAALKEEHRKVREMDGCGRGCEVCRLINELETVQL
jgi:hypothetical protein